MVIARLVKYPGMAKVTSKGRDYYYLGRGGPRIHAQWETPEFDAEYKRLRTPDLGDRGRFGTWVTRYRADKRIDRGGKPYCMLSDSTKRNWGPLLDAAKEHFGERSLRFFTRPDTKVDIRAYLDKWSEHPRRADMARQALSRLFSYMVAEGVLPSNPCEGLGNRYENNRSRIIWSDDHLSRLYAAASREVANAAKLAVLTGLRQADVLELEWAQVHGEYIERPTNKSEGEHVAVIPLWPDLHALLAEIPKRADTVLTNTYGAPWGTGFGSSWQAAMKRAGLADSGLHFHDLRGTAATKLFSAGFPLRDIAEMMGVEEETVDVWIKRYVKRSEIARDRIERMKRFVTPDNGGSERSKVESSSK